MKCSIKYIFTTLLCVLIFLPISVVLSRYDGLYFLCYLLFWVVLPGLLPLIFIKQVLKIRLEIPKGIFAVLTFLLGIFILFFEFFLLYFLGLSSLLTYINPVLSALSLVMLIIKYRRQAPSIFKLSSFLSNNLHLILLVIIGVYICALTMNFFMPDIRDVNYADYTWQIGNINQLASNHPFDDIRVTGVRFTYHFFNTLFLAIAKFIFGGDGWIFLTQYQIMYIPFLLCLSVYPLANVVVKNRTFALVLSLFMLSGFSVSYSFSDFTYQWASNANASGLAVIISVALFFTVMPVMQKNARLDRHVVAHIALSLVLFFLLCGVKGPFAIVFATAFIAYYLIDVIKNRSANPALGLLVAFMTITFIALFTTLLSSGSSGYFNADFFDKFLLTVNRTGYFSSFTSIIGEGLFARLLLLLPSLFMTITIATIPLLMSIVDMIMYFAGKKDLTPAYKISCLISYVGIAAYYTFFIEGTSQLYFLYCALPFVFYILAVKFNELKTPKTKYISLIILSLFSLNSFYSGVIPNLSDFSITAAKNYFLNVEENYSTTVNEEHDAFEFLKDYIVDDRLILSTRVAEPGDNDAVYHNISAFSEKKCYFEGFLYAERNLGFSESDVRIDELGYMFSTDWTLEEKYNFQISKNIGYIVIFSGSVDEIVHPNTGAIYRQIFGNNSVTVYELIV